MTQIRTDSYNYRQFNFINMKANSIPSLCNIVTVTEGRPPGSVNDPWQEVKYAPAYDKSGTPLVQPLWLLCGFKAKFGKNSLESPTDHYGLTSLIGLFCHPDQNQSPEPVEQIIYDNNDAPDASWKVDQCHAGYFVNGLEVKEKDAEEAITNFKFYCAKYLDPTETHDKSIHLEISGSWATPIMLPESQFVGGIQIKRHNVNPTDPSDYLGITGIRILGCQACNQKVTHTLNSGRYDFNYIPPAMTGINYLQLASKNGDPTICQASIFELKDQYCSTPKGVLDPSIAGIAHVSTDPSKETSKGWVQWQNSPDDQQPTATCLKFTSFGNEVELKFNLNNQCGDKNQYPELIASVASTKGEYLWKVQMGSGIQQLEMTQFFINPTGCPFKAIIMQYNSMAFQDFVSLDGTKYSFDSDATHKDIYTGNSQIPKVFKSQWYGMITGNAPSLFVRIEIVEGCSTQTKVSPDLYNLSDYLIYKYSSSSIYKIQPFVPSNPSHCLEVTSYHSEEVDFPKPQLVTQSKTCTQPCLELVVDNTIEAVINMKVMVQISAIAPNTNKYPQIVSTQFQIYVKAPKIDTMYSLIDGRNAVINLAPTVHQNYRLEFNKFTASRSVDKYYLTTSNGQSLEISPLVTGEAICVKTACYFDIDGSQQPKNNPQTVYVYGILPGNQHDPITYAGYSMPIVLNFKCSTEQVSVTQAILNVPIFAKENVSKTIIQDISSYFTSSDRLCPITTYKAYQDSGCQDPISNPLIVFNQRSLTFTPSNTMAATPIYIKASTEGTLSGLNSGGILKVILGVCGQEIINKVQVPKSTIEKLQQLEFNKGKVSIKDSQYTSWMQSNNNNCPVQSYRLVSKESATENALILKSSPIYMDGSGQIVIDTSSQLVTKNKEQQVFLEAKTTGGVVDYLPLNFKVNHVVSNFTFVFPIKVEEPEPEIIEIVEIEEEEPIIIEPPPKKEKDPFQNLVFETQEEEESYRDAFPDPIIIYPTIQPGTIMLSIEEWNKIREENLKKIEEMKKNWVSTEPVVQPKISKGQADSDGSFKIIFNQDMVVPDIFSKKSRRLQENDLSEVNVLRDISTLELVVNSEEQSLKDLQYEAFLKEWTERSFELQLNFQNPLAVSQDKLRDDFRFTLTDLSLFVSKNGLQEISIEESSIIFSFPRQFPSGVDKLAFEESVEAGATSVVSFVILMLILSFILKGLRDKLMFLFLNMQLVMTIAIYEILLPANVETFLIYIRIIVDAEYLKIDKIIGYFFPGESLDTLVFRRAKRVKPLSGNLQSSGVQSTSILSNLSQYILIASIFLVSLIFMGLSWVVFKSKRELIGAKLKKIKDDWLWNKTIKSLNIAYLSVCMAISIYFQGSGEAKTMIVLTTIINILLISALLFLPSFISYFSLTNSVEFLKNQKEDLKSNVENLYNLISIRKSKYNLLYFPEFYFRRFFFIFTPLFLNGRSEGQHVQTFLTIQTLHLIFLGQLSPFNIAEINFLEISIEALFMILGYCMIVFTSFVPDKQIHYNFGLFFNGTIITVIVINVLLLTLNIIKQAQRKLKLKRIVENRKKLMQQILKDRVLANILQARGEQEELSVESQQEESSVESQKQEENPVQKKENTKKEHAVEKLQKALKKRKRIAKKGKKTNLQKLELSVVNEEDSLSFEIERVEENEIEKIEEKKDEQEEDPHILITQRAEEQIVKVKTKSKKKKKSKTKKVGNKQ